MADVDVTDAMGRTAVRGAMRETASGVDPEAGQHRGRSSGRGERADEHLSHRAAEAAAVGQRVASVRSPRRLGLGDFRFHDLRHDLGTRLARNRQSQRVIMKVLGHTKTRGCRRAILTRPRRLFGMPSTS